MGARVGFFDGICTSGDGFVDTDGLAETIAVGAFDRESGAIAVAFGEGATLGGLDLDGEFGVDSNGVLDGTEVSGRYCDANFIDNRFGSTSRKSSLHKSDSSTLFTHVSVSTGS